MAPASPLAFARAVHAARFLDERDPDPADDFVLVANGQVRPALANVAG